MTLAQGAEGGGARWGTEAELRRMSVRKSSQQEDVPVNGELPAEGMVACMNTVSLIKGQIK